MKSKISTLIAISALGIIGLTNINAIADNKSMARAEVVTEKEENLTIESWMTNENYWSSNDLAEREHSLTIESWMTDENNWTSGKVAEKPESDDSLKIESWMTNEGLWE